MSKSMQCELDGVLSMISNSEQLSENTKLRHMQSLKTFARINRTTDVCRILLSPNETFQKTRKHISQLSTLHTMLIGVLSTISHIKSLHPQYYNHHEDMLKQWYVFSAQVSREIRQIKGKNKMSPRQMQAHIPWEKVISKVKYLSKTQYGSREHLLLAMYTLMPPRRQMDYYRVCIVSGNRNRCKNDELSSGEISKRIDDKFDICIHKFKTAKFMDTWEKTLPDKLCAVLNSSLMQHPRKYLFVDSDDQPFERVNSFTQFTNRILKKYLGEHVTVNTLRHAYASYLHRHGIDPETAAYDMAHSVEMHKSYVFHDENTR